MDAVNPIEIVQIYNLSDSNRQVETKNENSWRTEYRRDFARLIHAPCFRRLQGKTQLFPSIEGDFFRNRLTHSLEVAQIAKSIAMKLNAEVEELKDNSLDFDLIEFACLAHDLGHPPFGHNGEEALNEKMKKYGGFESNAQVLRILTKVEKKDLSFDSFNNEGDDLRNGLNLTFRSLSSIIKYDNEIDYGYVDEKNNVDIDYIKRNNKIVKELENGDCLIKGYYSSEKEIVKKIKENVLGNVNLEIGVIESSIMDIADDIAYSTYDIEDALKAGFITIMDLISPDLKLANSIASKCELKEIKEVTDITSILLKDLIDGLSGKFGSKEELLINIRKMYLDSKKIEMFGNLRIAFTSRLVGNFVEKVKFDFDDKVPKNSKAILPDDTKKTVDVLKKFTYVKLIQSPEFQIVAVRGKEIIKDLFDRLEKEDGRLLPSDFKNVYDQAVKVNDKKRVICDFISGMTDRYCVEFYARLTSENPSSIFKPI